MQKLNKTEILVRIEALLNNLYSLSKNDVVNYCRLLVPEFKSTNRKYKEQHERSEPENIENIANAELIRKILKKLMSGNRLNVKI